MNPHEIVRQNYRQIRRSKGLTGAVVADRAQRFGSVLDGSVLANYETGRRSRLGIDETIQLAMALEVGLVDLLTPPQGETVTLGDYSIDSADWLEWLAPSSSETAVAVALGRVIDNQRREIQALKANQA